MLLDAANRRLAGRGAEHPQIDVTFDEATPPARHGVSASAPVTPSAPPATEGELGAAGTYHTDGLAVSPSPSAPVVPSAPPMFEEGEPLQPVEQPVPEPAPAAPEPEPEMADECCVCLSDNKVSLLLLLLYHESLQMLTWRFLLAQCRYRLLLFCDLVLQLEGKITRS